MQTSSGLTFTDVDSTRWVAHVRRLTRNASGLAISRASGVNQSTISRWFDEQQATRPSALAVIAIARAYRGSIVDALVAAGYIAAHEAKIERFGRDLSEVSTQEIAEELARRAQVAS